MDANGYAIRKFRRRHSKSFSILKPGTIHKGFNNLEIKNGIEPHYLRRRKEECLEELPELIEENVYIDMTKEQRLEYDNFCCKNTHGINQTTARIHYPAEANL